MAKRLASFPGEVRPQNRYPFPELAAVPGSVWELSAEDFPQRLTPRELSARAHTWATNHQQIVRTVTDRENGTVILQFRPKEEVH
jgi:hypothetical protein